MLAVLVSALGISCSFERHGGTALCGDGVVGEGEECDDGNVADGDECPSTCRLAACGDGLVQSGVEGCDDGNTDDGDSCLTSCVSSTCGDGVTQDDSEQCDDGNDDNTDDCPNNCVVARCGDNYVFAGVEECDDANNDETDACRNDCSRSFCGDGVILAGVEECDDGNNVNGDGCEANCRFACGNNIPSVKAAVRTASSCYVTLNTIPMNWTTARATCSVLILGGDLASIGSQADNDAAKAVLRGAHGWIGYNDRADGGSFEWSDGSPVGYENWDNDEPNDSGDEDCAELYSDTADGVWNDNNCNSAKQFICETP